MKMWLDRALLLAALLAMAACESPTAPSGSRVLPDVSEYVTPELAARLDPDGHFVLSQPVAPGSRAILSSGAAEDLAASFLKTFFANPDFRVLPGAGDPRQSIEDQHGHGVKWSDVRAGHPYYAATYVEALPDSFPNFVHNHYGPRYLFPLMLGEDQVGALSVAAYATDVSLSADGYVVYPRTHGNEFRTGGLAHGTGYGLPLSPEEAVAYAGTQLPVRIAEVPRLQLADLRWTPLAARWRLVLESEAEFTRLTDGTRVVSRIVYVGGFPSLSDDLGEVPSYRRRLFVPASPQPATEEVFFRWPRTDGVVDVEWPLVEPWASVVAEVVPVAP